MNTLICEYPSLAIEGERIRVEQTGHGCFQLCRIDRRGRRIRAMTMQISRDTVASHLLMARKHAACGEDVVVGEMVTTRSAVAR